MANIRSWSQTANSNNSASPNGWPEGMPPSGVNNTGRENMAGVRTFADELPYYDSGDTPSRASAATFKVATDVTASYVKGRRIKCLDGSTLYGTITASSYGAPDTTVTVGLDSGSLTASLSSIALAILSPTNLALPHGISKKGADIASDTTTDLSAATGDYVDITGTTTITGLGTANSGVERAVTFTGILTLTHNATSLILPGGANITTAAGDSAIFKSRGSGNWQCISYAKASGQAVLGAPFIDSTAIIKGSADATKLLRVEVDGFTTGTTRVWTAPDQDIDLTPATQAQMETAAATDRFVPPGRVHNHPGVAKFWAYTTVSAGTPTLSTSYNVTSITDTATGKLTITIATDFSAATWCCSATTESLADDTNDANRRLVEINAAGIAAGTIQVCAHGSLDIAASPFADPISWHVMGMGDQ